MTQNPSFFRPRPVPFALKDSIDQELDRLENADIITNVRYSDWAAPIVVVPKKDGKLRICGDYKITLNPSLEVAIAEPVRYLIRWQGIFENRSITCLSTNVVRG